jgi:Ca2+-binding RTX toxin-like protein
VLVGGPGADLLLGGAGNDRINATAGAGDIVDGGDGRDTIRAVDGARDRIGCGRQRDRVYADAIDRVARDCEVVARG